MKVAILGGGQLGRMMALAAHPLGVETRLLDPSAEACAGQVAPLIAGNYDDPAALARLIGDGVDAVTYEFENVPAAAAHYLHEQGIPLYPPPLALEKSQDRLVEKLFLQSLEIPTPPFAPVDDHDQFHAALQRIGFPAVLKTRRHGYDGKGQSVIASAGAADSVWNSLHGRPLILERFVKFNREVSIIVARGRDGSMVFYPLVENEHRHAILFSSLAPAPNQTQDYVSDAGSLFTQAEQHARRLLEALEYVGVAAIEFFDVGGQLLVNEFAPRVHNSGHWTIEGAETSQFENHLRAILGWPLGSTSLVEPPVLMMNLIGHSPEAGDLLAMPGAHLHLYGKSPRAGRKIGHVTIRQATPALRRRLQAIIEPHTQFSDESR